MAKLVEQLSRDVNQSNGIIDSYWQQSFKYRNFIPGADSILPTGIVVDRSIVIKPLTTPKAFQSPIRSKKTPVTTPKPQKYNPEDFQVDIGRVVDIRSNAAGAIKTGYKIEELRAIVKLINSQVPKEQRIFVRGGKKPEYINALREFFGLEIEKVKE